MAFAENPARVSVLKRSKGYISAKSVLGKKGVLFKFSFDARVALERSKIKRWEAQQQKRGQEE